jgi:hypothetical protein
MEINPWFLVVVSAVLIGLCGLSLFFFKKRKSRHFIIVLFIVLIFAAIFLHGVSFRML